LTDVTWTVTNEGNTTSVFTTNIRAEYPDYFNGEDPPLIAQVLVYKVHRVPVDKDCQLYESHQDELIANISNPRVQNPRVQNSPPAEGAGSTQSSPISTQAADLSAQDITFYLAPEEQAEVTFRVWDEDTTDGGPTFSPDMVIAEAVAEAVNTEDVEVGSTTPPSDVPPNSEPWTTPQPAIEANPPALTFSVAFGINPPDQVISIGNSGNGALNYAISDDVGWLTIVPTSGIAPQNHTLAIDVTGLSAGVHTGTIAIIDPYATNNPLRVPVTLTISATPPPLFITTTSIPDGVRNTSYSVFLDCSGGLGEVTWSVSAGSLPPGLSLENTEGGTGWIIGTPTAAGYFSFTVQAQTALQSVTRSLSMTIADWVARYNGPDNNNDEAFLYSPNRSTPIAVDAAGNIYVTGQSVGTGTDQDYATIKYSSSGAEQWVARYNGTINGFEYPEMIAVDALGNVYVTGNSSLQTGDYDLATVKYNSAGVEQWVATYNGPANGWDRAHAMAVDASGNVYVTGDSNGIGTSSDYVTVKYNSFGIQQWVARYNGPGNAVDTAYSIALDPAGNVYVTGLSAGSGTDYDYATVKYDSSGEEQWVVRYDGPASGQDWPSTVALDSSGNVYVAGFSVGSGTGSDYATIKYNSSGNQQWVQRYDHGAGDDWTSAMSVDAIGNVYVTGQSSGGYLTGFDCATIKYNALGVQQWVARYSGPQPGEDKPFAIAVDPLQNVYIAGYSFGSGTAFDYITVKYNSIGAQEWAASYNGPANGTDQGNGVAQDPLGNVLVMGGSVGIGTAFDFATVKYAQSFPSALIISTDLLDNGYVGMPYAKALWAFGGSGTRQWQLAETAILPPGLVLNSSTGIISGTPTTPGTYDFSVLVIDGLLDASKSLSITITEALPDLVVESLTVTPPNPTFDNPVTFTAVVKNRGIGPAGPSYVVIWVSAAMDLYYPVGALAPGASSAPITRTYTFGVLDGPDHWVDAWADNNGTGDDIIESNESNNRKLVTFTVTALSDRPASSPAPGLRADARPAVPPAGPPGGVAMLQPFLREEKR
jgi:uncharacterized delta-60 repeat protein